MHSMRAIPTLPVHAETYTELLMHICRVSGSHLLAEVVLLQTESGYNQVSNQEHNSHAFPELQLGETVFDLTERFLTGMAVESFTLEKSLLLSCSAYLFLQTKHSVCCCLHCSERCALFEWLLKWMNK